MIAKEQDLHEHHPSFLRRALIPLLTTVALLIVLGVCTGRRGPVRAEQNVIIVVFDAVRADHLGTYGYARPTDPNLKALAAGGVAFRNAYAAAPWTLPSFASIFTGLYPIRHHLSGGQFRLNKKAETLAGRLKAEGYATAAIVANAYLNRDFGLDQGFDTFTQLLSEERLDAVTSPQTTAAALDWLERNRDRKFFLVVHFMDTHGDYIPPAPYDTLFDPGYNGPITGRGIGDNPNIKPGMPPEDVRHLLALYDGEIAWADKHLGLILKAVKDYGLDRKTIIVVTADHGEGFFEHGQIVHGYGLGDELLHIPLIIKTPAPETFLSPETTVSSVDIYPTILDLLGLPLKKRIDGKSLANVRAGKPGQTRRPNEPVFAELDAGGKRLRAMIEGRFKLIHDLKGKTFELYDLLEDPAERNDLVLKRPEIAGNLKNRLKEWTIAQRKRKGPPPAKAKPSARTLEGLKALGYIK